MTYRDLSAQALAEQDYESFLTELHHSLTDGRKDPNDVVRDTLFQIYFGAAERAKSFASSARGVAQLRSAQRHNRA